MDIHSFPWGFIPYSQNNTLIANNTNNQASGFAAAMPSDIGTTDTESKKTLDEINGYFENKSLGSIVSDFFSDIFKPNSSSDSNGDEYVNMLNDYVSRYTDSVNTSSEVAQKSSESLKNLAEGQ